MSKINLSLVIILIFLGSACTNRAQQVEPTTKKNPGSSDSPDTANLERNTATYTEGRYSPSEDGEKQSTDSVEDQPSLSDQLKLKLPDGRSFPVDWDGSSDVSEDAKLKIK